MEKSQQKPTGELVIRTIAMPKDTNSNGDMFGGWLVSEMDLGAGIIAKKQAKSRTATVAIDAMQFLKPVHVGDTISCYAEVIHVGRTSMKIKIEAWTTSIDQQEHVKVTEGIFTFVAIDEQGRPHPVIRNG